jgi:hypothetical protein
VFGFQGESFTVDNADMVASSAMPGQIHIEKTTATIEWEDDNDTTHSLATPDPVNSPIQFTLRLDSIPTQGKRGALFEVMVPVRLKGEKKVASIYLRLSPLIISSFTFTTKAKSSDLVKTTFDSAVTCLDFQLKKTIAVLAPTYVQTPVTPVRPLSGKVLDALRELSRALSMRIYIRDESITASQLSLIRDAILQRTLDPLSGPDYDVSRMFGGTGAEPVNLSLSPPSYDAAVALPGQRWRQKRQQSADMDKATATGVDHNGQYRKAASRSRECRAYGRVENREHPPAKAGCTLGGQTLKLGEQV